MRRKYDGVALQGLRLCVVQAGLSRHAKIVRHVVAPHLRRLIYVCHRRSRTKYVEFDDNVGIRSDRSVRPAGSRCDDLGTGDVEAASTSGQYLRKNQASWTL
jgi:hypothetical protein